MNKSKQHPLHDQRSLVLAIRATFCAGILGYAGTAAAAMITVTDGDDAGSGSTCTLRQAIASASTDDAGSSTCTAGSGADTIVFAAGITTVTLGASGHLLVSGAGAVTISGGPAGVTIDGNNAYRVFDISTTAGVSFDHLTIQHGKVTNDYGAGIRCRSVGTLTVSDSTITGNTAQSGNAGGMAVNVGCSAILTNSIVSGNFATYRAGGIDNAGSLTLTQSTVSDNTVEKGNGGGGIRSSYGGQVTITDSTISGNQALTSSGAGISVAGNSTLTLARVTFYGNQVHSPTGDGGAISSASSNVSSVNSTFYGNVANGGPAVSAFGGSVTLTNNTVAGNATGAAHGQIEASSATVTLVNTIVANAIGGSNCLGTISDGGGNLDDGSSCGLGVTSLSNADAALGALADNGGVTLTQLPNPDSAAIDAIACTNAPLTDQRGVPRPQGPKCDVGAVEAGLGLSVTDNSLFGFYGDTVLYIVTMENKNAAAAAGVQLSASGSAALNNPGTLWFCTIGDCTTTPTGGPLSDTATIPAGGSLTWLVSVPVLADSNESTATLTVSASGAGTTSDIDTLAIFRGTFE